MMTQKHKFGLVIIINSTDTKQFSVMCKYLTETTESFESKNWQKWCVNKTESDWANEVSREVEMAIIDDF